MESETTTVQLLKTTVEHLKKLGQKGDTYDQIIQRLLELAEKEA